jgi:hypothetical protein
MMMMHATCVSEGTEAGCSALPPAHNGFFPPACCAWAGATRFPRAPEAGRAALLWARRILLSSGFAAWGAAARFVPEPELEAMAEVRRGRVRTFDPKDLEVTHNEHFMQFQGPIKDNSEAAWVRSLSVSVCLLKLKLKLNLKQKLELKQKLKLKLKLELKLKL